MYPPQQRRQRLGQSQRPYSMPQHPPYGTNFRTRVVRDLRRRRGTSRKTQDLQEITTIKPRMVSSLATHDDFNGSQNQSQHEFQNSDLMSTVPLFQEAQGKLYRTMVAIETAVTNMAEANVKRFKTTTWFLDELEFMVNSLAVAVGATAALTPTWDEMAG